MKHMKHILVTIALITSNCLLHAAPINFVSKLDYINNPPAKGYEALERSGHLEGLDAALKAAKDATSQWEALVTIYAELRLTEALIAQAKAAKTPAVDSTTYANDLKKIITYQGKTLGIVSRMFSAYPQAETKINTAMAAYYKVASHPKPTAKADAPELYAYYKALAAALSTNVPADFKIQIKQPATPAVPGKGGHTLDKLAGSLRALINQL